MPRDTARAAKAFRDFTGARPSKVTRAQLDAHDVTGWKLGQAVGVAYEATRDGQRERYFHEFRKASRPSLVARDDGRQLYFSGGRYKVTDRGIEDMPALFVVNPSPRPSKRRKAAVKRRKPMARRRRTSARRRRGTRQVAIFRANPVRRRRRRSYSRRRALTSFRANPIRRRRSSYRRNPVARRRYRRNPIGSAGYFSLRKFLLPAAGIGAGAVGSEILMGYLPLPDQLKQGVMRHVTKGVVGIGAGIILGKVLRQKRLGNAFALGAVVIAVHDAIKEAIASRMPAIRMGGYGQYVPPIPSSFAGRGMGYTNPGQIARMGQYVPQIASSFSGAPGAQTRVVNPGETAFAA